MESLYKQFKTYEEILELYCNVEKILDLSQEHDLAPTTLSALLCFMANNDVEKIKFNSNLEKMQKTILNHNEIAENIAFVKLPTERSMWFENEEVFELVDKLNPNKYAGMHSAFFMVNELITNIYDHSTLFKEEIGWGRVFAYENLKEDYLDLCVVDNGLTIPNKFEIKGIDFKDDCDAIYKATQQFSTENSPKLNICNRGIGLWATLKLAIEGNDGNALIVSRDGLLSINNSENYKYELLENTFEGTLVCLRLKSNQIENFYDLIESYGDFDFNYEG